MVEQSGESFLLPFPCCLPHTVQSLGHALPALCRTHVRLNDVLLSLRPSLPSFRGSLRFSVRLVHWYYGTVRLLWYVHVRCLVYGLCGPVLFFRTRRTRDLPVLVHVVSQRARVLRLRRTEQPLANSVAAVLPSSISERSRHPDPSAFRSSIAPPTGTSGLRFTRHLTVPPARLEARMESLFSFPVGLFHPLQHAGLSRRTPDCRSRHRSADRLRQLRPTCFGAKAGSRSPDSPGTAQAPHESGTALPDRHWAGNPSPTVAFR